MTTYSEKARGGVNSPPRTFALHAFEYYNLGLCIIPCDGKKALVPWKKYQSKKPSKSTIYRWSNEYPCANIGIITGEISNLTIVDCDSKDLTIESLKSQFGDSPVVVSTPRGGFHLYYSFNGESCKTNYENQKIDIRSTGGYVIAPYSFNIDKNDSYKLVQGSLEDFTKLSVGNLSNTHKTEPLEAYEVDKTNNSDLVIEEGHRNQALFDELRNLASSCKSYETLLNKANDINAMWFSKPLDSFEVIATTKKVWSYKVTGRLYIKNKSRKTELINCLDNKDAFFLLEFLRGNHDGIRKHFYISQKPVAEQLKWSIKTLRKAIEFLLAKKHLVRQKIKNKKVSNTKKIKAYMYKYSFY